MTELRELSQMRAQIRERNADELARRIGWRPGAEPVARRHSAARGRSLRSSLLRPVPLVAVALAGAAAATVIVVPGVSGLSDESPRPGGNSPVEGSRTPAHAKVTLDSRSVLLAAAARAAKAPEGTYWHVKDVWGITYQTSDGYLVEQRDEFDHWSSADVLLVGSKDLGAKPLRDEDQAAWKRAGKPATWQVKSNDVTRELSTKEGALQYDKPSKPRYKVGDRVMTPKELADLPTDPEQLDALLARAKRPNASHIGAFLLAEAPVPPQVRAAAYRLLADTPGIRLTENVTDPLGRTGTGIGQLGESEELGEFEQRLVIDQKTGMLLANETIAVNPPANRPWAKAGTVLQYQAYTTTEWTDDKPDALD
ncbi:MULTISPECIES: CU044_5270 family protein [unclassified Nonomuraea]|uniref:CU044_5270 family protein n=1 Tax=unclassified Nonomuraea TaxID=2593643 RepID=UPI0033FD930C